jgi:hypothetical protein
MRYLFFSVAISVLALIGCNAGHGENKVSGNEDRAVILVALQNFSEWDEATFGELKGVLSVSPETSAPKDLSVESVRREAPRIADAFEDGLAAAFVARNRTAVSAAPLTDDSTWAQALPEDWEPNTGNLPPKGAKATGSITLPGFSDDRTRALLQVQHSWSIHGATVTYVLEKKGGHWQVAARDQEVYL